MKHQHYLKLLLIASILGYGMSAYAFNIRNTYTSSLICTLAARPHTTYKIPSHNSSVKLKTAGKYNCRTSDKLYISTCSVSSIQPTATFNTDDGSASCSTPIRIQK
jgi:hypothetical protein